MHRPLAVAEHRQQPATALAVASASHGVAGSCVDHNTGNRQASGTSANATMAKRRSHVAWVRATTKAISRVM